MKKYREYLLGVLAGVIIGIMLSTIVGYSLYKIQVDKITSKVKYDQYYCNGVKAYTNGDTDQAVMYLKKCLEINPEHISAKTALIKLQKIDLIMLSSD